ncbi:hypothetical protein [Denitromonas iodatirespirans]|uniref:Uncharacterized protein n=1 Tax=Denitromonas iodatirespirans TaxID=2795389 RepID=A0A944D835_DENI1|nr:hypothetical protein [Denitromonas iodatirespirans]MBT0961694.1 hypothetical protein [Denitromonas iodatirespirans]
MTTPITDTDLRWAYDCTGWAARGISFETATASPDLAAGLRLRATVRLRRIARLKASNTGAGIERSTRND